MGLNFAYALNHAILQKGSDLSFSKIIIKPKQIRIVTRKEQSQNEME
jgi:hypothetical protein